LTTVLGLVPLLFETSRQALFLKPTVITLCYGLGFGLVLVLLIVPSLVVVQKDIAAMFVTFRRILLGKKLPRSMRGLFIAVTVLAVVLLVSSSGYLLVMQSVAPWIVDILPPRVSGMAVSAPVMVTLLAVLAGMLVITAAGYILLVLLALLGRRTAAQLYGTGIADKR